MTAPRREYLWSMVEWLEEQIDPDQELNMTADNNDTDDEEQTLEDIIEERSSSSHSLSDLKRPMNLDPLVDEIMSYRHAVGEYKGFPASVDVTYKSDENESYWEITIKVKRKLVGGSQENKWELVESDNKGTDLLTSSITKSHTRVVDDTVVAYKTFEDTCDKYGLTEITDPDMPEYETLDPEEYTEESED